ncbi:MAG TPA: class I SAM-dependent methyltransferase [Sphingomicrobium sp.]|nr:class I SAM-dependent methyltransferase [Sphingomicrobium sp.]
MASALHKRAQRAIERQLAYQQRKAERVRGHEEAIIDRMKSHSARVRDKLAALRPIAADSSVLEVGSGAHGLIFYFDGGRKVGIDPLADQYRELFPAWQGRATTIAAYGEELPFEDSSFDFVLCDNVVDHAESPRRIVAEIARVLKPGGLLYFTVNIHHSVYHWADRAHAGWRALGIPIEVTPFADHTVHLTLDSARALFCGLPLTVLDEKDTIAATKREKPRIRHAGDRLKRLFFKNAQYELIAERV